MGNLNTYNLAEDVVRARDLIHARRERIVKMVLRVLYGIATLAAIVFLSGVISSLFSHEPTLSYGLTKSERFSDDILYGIGFGIGIPLAIYLYTWPTRIALKRKSSALIFIAIWNLGFSWAVFPYVWSMIWALTGKNIYETGVLGSPSSAANPIVVNVTNTAQTAQHVPPTNVPASVAGSGLAGFSQPEVGAAVEALPAPRAGDVLEQLQKLGKLRADGVISEEEFQQMKQKLTSL